MNQPELELLKAYESEALRRCASARPTERDLAYLRKSRELLAAVEPTRTVRTETLRRVA